MSFERNSPIKVSANPGEAEAGATASPGEVRVLALLQPWATLWAAGAKLIETRGWGTEYRGRIAVHASKGFDRDVRNICTLEPFVSVLRRLGYANADQLPRGVIIGAVTLTACELMVPAISPSPRGTLSMADPRIALGTNEREFGHYEPGRYAWITDQFMRWKPAEPIQFKGGLGLRKLDVEIARRIGA